MHKIIAFGVACVLSFFLFVGMNLLIDSEAKAVPSDSGVIFEPGVKLSDLTPEPKTIMKKEPPEFKELLPTPDSISEAPSEKPQLPARLADSSPEIKVAINYGPEDVKASLANINSTGPGTGLAPAIRIEPHYPPEAAKDGIEGYVTLQFDIDATGSPTNIVILESNPRGYFEKVSRNAVRKWKFDPQKEAGQAVSVYSQVVTLDFKLEKES